MPRKSERTRHAILAQAVDLSTEVGLGGLSIGQLASATGMSKSGLFAHFGGKEALQLATVRFAAERFEREVVAPARRAPPGLFRLRAMLEHWIGSIEATSNRGGCFFDAASSEFGSRAGAVRGLLARVSGEWRDALANEARVAVDAGELFADTDPDLLAFRLHALVGEANWARELLDDPDSFQRARDAAELALALAGAPAQPEGVPHEQPPE